MTSATDEPAASPACDNVVKVSPEAWIAQRATQRKPTWYLLTPENDPYGEHECAVLTVAGRQILFKVDYYDPTMEFGSSDPGQTARLLTIMLVEEA